MIYIAPPLPRFYYYDTLQQINIPVVQNIWQFRVNEYWKQMKSVVRKNYFRNVMDMNSNLGGFGAAFKDTDVWVMNVAPVNMSARLKIIYDRGLIGTVHDWYAFNQPYIYIYLLRLTLVLVSTIFTDVGFLSSLSWLLYIYKLELLFCSCVIDKILLVLSEET